MNKLLKIFLSFSALFLVLGANNAWAKDYKRIVSLSPAVTNILFSLDKGENIIAVTDYCIVKDENSAIKRIGNITNPNLELIYSLKPDLVLSTAGLTNDKLVAKLKALGIEAYDIKPAKSYAEIIENYTKLATVLSCEELANQNLNHIDQQIESIRNNYLDTQVEYYMWQVGVNPLVVAGRDTFINDMIAVFSAKNIFANLPAQYPRVSREEVFVRNPDRVFIITMGNVSEKEKDTWGSFANLKSVMNNKIHVIDSYKVSLATPFGFLSGVRELEKHIKGESV